jgi:hypothetical protein
MQRHLSLPKGKQLFQMKTNAARRRENRPGRVHQLFIRETKNKE